MLLLRTIAEGKTEKTRLPALIAFIAMAHGSQAEFVEAFGEASELWRYIDRQEKDLRRLAKQMKQIKIPYGPGECKRLSANMDTVLSELREAMEKARTMQDNLNVTDEPHRLTLFRRLLLVADLEELRTLAFRLNVNYDDLRGEGREAKARELVALLERGDRLRELQDALERPDMNGGGHDEQQK